MVANIAGWLARIGLLFLGLWLLQVILNTYISFKGVQRRVADLPGAGAILWIDPFRSLSLVLGNKFPLKDMIGYYSGKFAPYERYGSTCLISVKLWNAETYYWFSDADALKTITTERVRYQKDVVAYEALNIYGDNLVGTEGSDWKRHRAISAPAFNEANNALVWNETIRVINEWFDVVDGSANGDETLVDTTPAMVQATLLVIAAAGFGRRASWSEDSSTEAPSGHTMTFRSAVADTVENVVAKVLLPSWLGSVHIPYLSAHVRHVDLAFAALRGHMVEVVSQARAHFPQGKEAVGDGTGAALLNNLVEANMSDDARGRNLSDEEVLSNTFTFLLAGHETSAHSLSFAMALLALHPDAQARIFEEAKAVWPGGAPMSASGSSYKNDFPKLEYTLAVFRETLRLFPAVTRLVKHAHGDGFVLARKFPAGLSSTVTANGEDCTQKFTVSVPAGSWVVGDIWALHHNPLHWGANAGDFDPARFIDTPTYKWPRDAFLAFSGGPRGCIGQRFSLTESVCILASVIRRYEIVLPEGMTKESVLKWKTGVTITPTNAWVKLKRRRE